jgi:glycosyltransferase involved in cell wall biosynthesis
LTAGRTIGFIGSFYAYEGLALLVEAAPMIRDQYDDLKILLVGGGVEADRLRESVRRKGLDDTVIFTGRVPHDQVARYYNLIDILIYPRLSMRLTELVTPLKPLEAMAQERLVVASDVGGHREMIDHDRTGILFRPDDAEDLGTAVNRLLKETDRWPTLRQCGREFVEKERNWEASVSRYRDVYQGCIGAFVS